MSGDCHGRNLVRLSLAALNFAFLFFHLTGVCRATDASWTANLAVGTNADGRMELFEVDKDGSLRHRWQRESLHDWSAWSSMGGRFLPGVAVANDSTGRLCAFAVDKETRLVNYNFQKEPNSPAWSNWSTLPDQTVAAPVASAQDADGRLEIFALGAKDHGVKHIFQDEGREDWSEWTDLGGPFEEDLVIARNKTGQLELFGINATNHLLMHCWQTNANESEDWTSWASLDAPISPGFAVGQNTNGRLEIVGVNPTNGVVYHAYQQIPVPSTDWSKWLSLGAKMRPEIALGVNRDGRIEIFTVNPTNSMIYHTFQYRGGATENWVGWTDMSVVGGLKMAQLIGAMPTKSRWTDIGGSTRSFAVVGKGSEDELDLFAYDERLEDVLNYRRQISGSLLWTDWSSLDHTASHFLSHTWRMDDGLPDNRVQCLAQTPDGYLWVGTHNGLARFDGVQFSVFDTKKVFGVPNSSVACLCAGHDGTLWAGSDEEGLACVSAAGISRYSRSNGLAGNSVTVIFEARDHSLWIGTTAGLSHYSGGNFVNYSTSSGLVSDNIRSAIEDSFGGIWITTDRGLNSLKNGQIMAYTRTNGLPEDNLAGIWQDFPGRFWIGSDQGLIFYRGAQFYAYDTRYGLSDRLVRAIRSDENGNLWVGNNSGLNVFKEGRFFEESDQEGNSFGKINALFEDTEGNLWAGSDDGLIRVTPTPLLRYGKQQQLTHNNVSSVMEDASGNLWIGTWGGGLDKMKDEAVTVYSPVTGFQFDLISALCKAKDGGIWVSGSYGSGLVELSHGRAVFRATNAPLATVAVKVLAEDREGKLWIGSSKGLACLAGRMFVTNSVTDRLTDSDVRAICEGANGTMWFGTGNGLWRWQSNQFSLFSAAEGLSDNVITALYEDEQRDLWIGTQNGGLNHWHAGHLTHYAARQGLFSDEIFEIIEDDLGWLWMSCSKGVFRVNKKNLEEFDHHRSAGVTSVAYGHDNGMESVFCGTGKPGAWKTRDGELWFPTGKGLVAIDPKILKINRTPPSVYVEAMIVDTHPLSTADNFHAADAVPGRDSSLSETRVPPGRGELEFHYTAPDFIRPEKIRFRYKLDGIDSEWIEAGVRRVAYYNNLSPGHYTFHVTACNSDGYWSESGASMPIFLAPHLWQTWWFQTAAVLLVVGAVAASARQITKRRMQRKMERLEQRHAIEKERLRIARDIHDDLGGSLTQIALLGELAMNSIGNPSQAARHLNKITDSARMNVRALDEIVWAVHPGNDTLNSLVLYLWQFAEEFFGATNARCRVEAPASIPSYPLSSDLRHDIFLVVKEAFNNTIRHANATEVRLRFNMRGSDFVLAIEDNGRGFQMTSPNGAGHGLSNMKKRIEEIGGEFSVSSEPGKGTRIELILALKNYHDVN